LNTQHIFNMEDSRDGYKKEKSSKKENSKKENYSEKKEEIVFAILF